ncbi:sigma-70 family RNA polymerase sigma factor [Fulvivirga sp. RKSG066]|uniref:sigma-70 family RNA polymerase sigma factor n=1 Tax=Fulvivirga aurantia TaxID=2529383 RepID=UPI00162977B4|nr:sigma-70 family RNA polymerase sigma factor [Fulvivirga aurantia]
MTQESNDICQEKTFEAVFRSLAPVLRNFLLYKFRDATRAEDIVQEAFVVLWEACKKVSIEKAKSFLFKVGQNKFLKLLDKDIVKEKYDDLTLVNVEVEDPAFTLEHRELSEKLKQAIAQLPEGQREVFLLHRIDGMSYKEIADSLEVSVKAIEKRMHKALLKLRMICKSL